MRLFNPKLRHSSHFFDLSVLRSGRLYLIHPADRRYASSKDSYHSPSAQTA